MRFRTKVAAVFAAVAAVGLSLLAIPNAHAANQRPFWLHQDGVFVANLCITNQTKSNTKVCTGNVPKGSNREVWIDYDEGDQLRFDVNAVLGAHAWYVGIAPRDANCYSTGISLIVNAYCRETT